MKVTKSLIGICFCCFFVSFVAARVAVPSAVDEQPNKVHELRDQHDKENKTPEEQADYDEEVLFGGDEALTDIHEMDEEHQQTRLKALVENKMDANKDNFVDKAELAAYTEASMVEMQNRELKQEFENIDTNTNGQITWKEFSDALYGNIEKEKNEMTIGEYQSHLNLMEYDKKMFGAADKNGDGKLNVEELKVMRNPALTAETKKVFIDKVLAEEDTNKDGAVDSAEYIAHMKKIHDDDGADDKPEWLTVEQQRFKDTIDSNKDGLIKDDEIFKWRGPLSNEEQAQQEAAHLIKECDQNDDGKLTLTEILDNHHEWINSQTTSFGKHLEGEL